MDKSETKDLNWENFCIKCVYYDKSIGVCSEIHENVRSYPKKFLNKCNGKYFIQKKEDFVNNENNIIEENIEPEPELKANKPKRIFFAFPNSISVIARLIAFIGLIIALIGCFGSFGKYDRFYSNLVDGHINLDGYRMLSMKIFSKEIFHDDVFSIGTLGIILFCSLVIIALILIGISFSKDNKFIKIWKVEILFLFVCSGFFVYLILKDFASFDSGSRLFFIGLLISFLSSFFIIPKKYVIENLNAETLK